MFCNIQGSGRALLFVHGLGSSHADWEYQFPEFSRRYKTLVPDLPGYGRSPPDKSSSIQYFSDCLQRLLDEHNVTEVVVIGHSMGGACALQLALDDPHRVRALVIVNSVPSFIPRTPSEHFAINFRRILMRLAGPQRLAKTMASRLFPHPHQHELRRRAIARGSRNTKQAYLSSLKALTKWTVRDRLHEIKVPVLIASSEHDYFAAEDVKQFVSELPDATLEFFADAHHNLPQEFPEEFNSVVLDFLSAHDYV